MKCEPNALSKPVAAFHSHGHTFIPPLASTCLYAPLIALNRIILHTITLNLLTPRAPPCYPPHRARGLSISSAL